MMIGLVALALQAAAPSGGSIDAAGKWGVDYSPEQCIINRQFGSGPVKSFLAIDASPVTGTGNIVLLVPGVATKGTFGTATMTVAPGNATLRPMWFARGSKDARAAIEIGVDQDGWAAIRASDTLTIKGPFASPLSVPVKGIDKAIAAAKTCGRTLLQSWGADPDAMIDTSGPKSPGDWITNLDYPPEALRNGESGTVKILLTIDPKGRPRDCKVVVSSRSPSLDATTCRIMMKRATFEPSSKETRYVFNPVAWRVSQ